jgi:ketosteroid isomerase-like protein
MSQENVEVVRRVLEAWNGGDVEAMLARLTSDFEFVTAGVVPDLRPVYRGHQGWRDFWDAYRRTFESLRIELNDLRDVDELVVARITQRARARQGLEVERQFGNVWTIRDGFVTRLVAYGDWNQALEAAGVAE